MVVEYAVGFVIGCVVTGVVFIVFGKNNKNKIAEARAKIVGLYEKTEGVVKDELKKAEELLKK